MSKRTTCLAYHERSAVTSFTLYVCNVIWDKR